MICKKIETRMQSASRRRENNLNKIKQRIKLEKQRKEHLFQEKIGQVQISMEH